MKQPEPFVAEAATPRAAAVALTMPGGSTVAPTAERASTIAATPLHAADPRARFFAGLGAATAEAVAPTMRADRDATVASHGPSEAVVASLEAMADRDATVASHGPSEAVVASLEATHKLAPGDVVAGRYRLVQAIGAGAHAEVWQSFDTQLQRDVALKTFVGVAASERDVESVVREAQASSSIVSDFVIRIHNACVDREHAVVAIDMELCREYEDGVPRNGAELARHVRPRGVRSRAEVRQAVRWVMEAARGVAEAHRQNVFHRDLKPANVLVRPVSGRAQVLDFGLAGYQIVAPRQAMAPAERHPTMTIELARRHARLHIAGTPAYMAPEQARGLPRLDPASDGQHHRLLTRIDVYGLGAVLYELLTGRAPHERSDDDSAAGLIARAQTEDVPLAPLARRPIPRRLARTLAQALASDPAERYPTAGALADDLQAFLALRPASADRRRPLLWGLLAARRNPQAVSTLLALVVLGLVSVLTFMSVERAKSAREEADRQALRATERTELAELAANVSAGSAAEARAERDAIAERKLEAERDARTAEQQRDDAETDAERQAANLRQYEAVLRARAAEIDGLRADLVAEGAAHAAAVSRLEGELAQERAVVAERDRAIAQKDGELARRDALLAERNTSIADKDAELGRKDAQIATLTRSVEQSTADIADKDRTIAQKNAELADKDGAARQRVAELADKDRAIAAKEGEIARKNAEIARMQAELGEKDGAIARLQATVAQLQATIAQMSQAPPPAPTAPAPTLSAPALGTK